MTRILVVDDVPSNVTVLTWMLMHQGYTVSSALSGPQALDMIAAERPDVVLMDISMPEMSGIEVCRRLKTDPQLRLIPIILVTARTRDEDMVEGLNAGADDYVAKPVTREILSAHLRSALRIKSIYDELADSSGRLRRDVPNGPMPKRSYTCPEAGAGRAIGGGIAHEFNNLLQTIEGYAAYAMEGIRRRKGGIRTCSRC